MTQGYGAQEALAASAELKIILAKCAVGVCIRQ